MHGQTIVIFGGSSGIGEATAGLLAARGARVIIVGRDRERLALAQQRLGDGVHAEAADASDPEASAALFRRIGRVDHAVLAHSGGKGAGPFRDLRLADLRSGLESKLLAQVTAAQAALAALAERGSLTFVSAISARSSMPGTAGLAAINGAIESMVRVLARELAPLRVNAVSPGVIDTPWWDAMPAAAKDAFFRQAADTLPARRVGQPVDVARAIAQLIENSFMTGSVLEVAGGAQL